MVVEAANTGGVEWAAEVRPAHGERVSGDAAVIAVGAQAVLIAIVDVLGHGVEAHQLAQRIAAFLRAHWLPEPLATLAGLHHHIRGSRGAAVGITILDRASGELRYAGVGNTLVRRFGAESISLVSADGVVGGEMCTALEQRVALGADDVLLLCTDGISSRFDLADYPAMRHDGVETIARTVLRRFGKDHDDAACIALRRAS